MRRSVPQVAAICALPLLLASCSANPATGRPQLSFYGVHEELAWGRKADAELVAHVGLYEDPVLQAYVTEVGERMARSSERPNLPWSFKILDDPAINAFSQPGGYVYVTRGILAQISSEAELAMLLGHEIGHVNARHSASQISKEALAELGLKLADSYFEKQGAPRGTLLQLLTRGMLGLFLLAHGRADEIQADQLGLRYLLRAGYNPWEGLDVFRLLEGTDEFDTAGRLPSWLSVHPDPDVRRKHIKRKLFELVKQGNDFAGTTVNREGYLQKLDGLVFGENLRRGFFRQGFLYHPELQFQFEFPDSWKTSSTRHTAYAISPKGDALLEISLSRHQTVDGAADDFFREGEMVEVERWEHSIRGLPASWHRLESVAEEGGRVGTVAFLRHQGRVFKVLALVEKSAWENHRGYLENLISTFRGVADPTILTVQPSRVRIIRLEKAMTLEAFARQYPSALSIETVAVLNGVEPWELLQEGSIVKLVMKEKG